MMQIPPFQLPPRIYQITTNSIPPPTQTQFTRFHQTRPEHHFLHCQLHITGNCLEFHRYYDRRLQAFTQMIGMDMGIIEKMNVLKKIVNALYNIISGGIRMRIVDLNTIFIDNANSLEVLFDVPIFHSLSKLHPIDYHPSLLHQLAIIFLQLITSSTSILNPIEQANNLDHPRLRQIIKMMLESHVDGRDSHRLLDLYDQLDRLANQMQQEEEEEEEGRRVYLMFEVDLFSDEPPRFFIDAQGKVDYAANKYYDFAFDAVDKNQMNIHLRSRKTKQILRYQMKYADLGIFKEQFEDMMKFHEMISTIPRVAFTISPSGFLSCWTSRNWQEIKIISKMHRLVHKVPHQKLAFNESPLYKYLVQAVIYPDNPLPPPIKHFLTNPQQFLRGFGLDLLKCKLCIESAHFFRKNIEILLQKNDKYEQFRGKGNDEDMLDAIADIYTDNNDGLLTKCSQFDRLFICEYLNIDMMVASEWYREILSKYPNNMAVIYGILNFTFQNNYYEITNEELKALCNKLQENFLKNNQKVNMLLANIYYYRLGLKDQARQFALYIIDQQNTENVTAMVIIYATSRHLDKMETLQRYLKTHPHCAFMYLQGLHYLNFQNKPGIALQIFEDCNRVNPYFRPAYHGMVKAITRQYQNNHKHLHDWIAQTAKIQQQCCEKNPKDAYIHYLRAIVLYRESKMEYRKMGMELFKRSLEKNPTFAIARLRVAQLQNQGINEKRSPFSTLSAFWHNNFGSQMEVCQLMQELFRRTSFE